MSAKKAVSPIKTMARVFKVSASGYYAWRGRPASARLTADADLTRKIRTIHAASCSFALDRSKRPCAPACHLASWMNPEAKVSFVPVSTAIKSA